MHQDLSSISHDRDDSKALEQHTEKIAEQLLLLNFFLFSWGDFITFLSQVGSVSLSEKTVKF